MRRYFLIFFLLFELLLGSVSRAQGLTTPWMIATATMQLLNSGLALAGFLQKSNQVGADPAFVYGVLNNAHELDARGLPVAPYLLKANEGLAKGISPAQIRPALERTRHQTEEAERWVNESQTRGLAFSNPGDRRMAIQEYQWALLNQVPLNVLQGFSQTQFQRGALPGYLKVWKVEQIPPGPWGHGWGPHGYGPPGQLKKQNSYNKLDHQGPKDNGWGAGKKEHGKNKQKF